MKIIEQKEFEKDGVPYTTNIYDNGIKETFQTAFPPKILQPPILTEPQEVAMNTLVNTEMLLALAELGGM